MERQEGVSFCSSNGASGENWVVVRGRIANGLATTDKQAMARAFETTTRTEAGP